LPAPEGAETTKRMPLRVSLNILYLLTNFFEFSLDRDHVRRQVGVVRFGAHSIGLAIEFLNKEIHLPANRLLAFKKLFQLLKVAAKTGHLFTDITAVGKECQLLGDTLFVNGIFLKAL